MVNDEFAVSDTQMSALLAKVFIIIRLKNGKIIQSSGADCEQQINFGKIILIIVLN